MHGVTEVSGRVAAPADAVPARPRAAGADRPDEPVDVRPAQRHVLGTVLVELAATPVLVVGAAALPDGAVPAVAAVTAAGLVAVRSALGARLAGAAGAAGWGTLALLQVAVLAPGLGETDDARVVMALVGLGAVPFVAGLLPTVTVGGLFAGRRDDVTPGLLAVAVAGGAGVLAAIAVADLVPLDDPRLPTLVPYVAAGMAVLALAEVLAHHRVGAGYPDTVAVVGALAAAAQAIMLVDTQGAPLDTAVTALVVAGGLAAVGLLVATALSTPRTLSVPVAEADGGPRLVGWALATLLALAVVARVVAVRPLWLDEAVVAQVSGGSLSDMLAATRHADAHPPLVEAVAWAVHPLLGAGDLALRVPSIVAGVALVPVVYVTATRLYDRRTGVIAAGVSAVGPGLLWLSQGARPGIFAALLATLALFTMLRAVDRGRIVDWMLFGLTGAVLVWSHQLAFLHAGVLLAAAGVVIQRRHHERQHHERQHHERVDVTAGRDVAGWASAALVAGGAFAVLLAWRGGLGPPTVLPPLEYATSGAPGAGRSVLGLVGTAVSGVVGFHPQDVTSRLLALWPLGILVTFALTVRRWSARGMLLVALAALPFVALLAVQVAGAPRSPLFALDWCATALPVLAIGLGRAASLAGPWPRARMVGAVVVAVLAVAAVDQAARVRPVERVDVAPAIDEVAAAAGDGDLVVFAPATLGGLVRHEVRGAEVVALPQAGDRIAGTDGRVLIVGAFGLADDEVRDRILALVEEISASRPLSSEVRHGDTTTWSFG